MMTAKKKVVRVSLQQTVDSVLMHDLKNLAFRLSAVLQNMDESYDSPMFKQSIAEILGDTVRRMDGIVNRYRQSQEQIVVKLKVDINQILLKALEDLPARRLRDIQKEVELTEIPQIWGDTFYLHNAFNSILENAIDAMPHGGRLSVFTHMITARKKQKISIEICDTGTGMHESFSENGLFNPFRTTKENGLGLGLFTSKQIIGMHNGKIEVVSAPNSGTTFRILLPVEENA